MSNKTILEKVSVDRREFKYKKGLVELNFTLRIDIKQELKDFRELLADATADLDKLIPTIK